jgi:hypothetical protein
MTRNPMLWSAHYQAARRHARGGTWFRFPRIELWWGREIHPQLPGSCKMAPAMSHVVLEPTMPWARMLRPIPRGPVVRSRCPHRHTDNTDTTQDQQAAHRASSEDSQAPSPFLFDQATGLPCKFDLNFEWECLLFPKVVSVEQEVASVRSPKVSRPHRPVRGGGIRPHKPEARAKGVQ